MTTIDVVAAGGLGLRLRSDGAIHLDPDFPTLLSAYVPGAVVAAAHHPGAVIVHRERPTPAATCSRRRVEICDTWHDRVGVDAYHLLHAMARAAWLERGWYSTHAACVETTPGEGILLVGPSGSGKTTVMLDLIDRGARLFASNKTVLTAEGGKLIAVAGTRTVTLPESCGQGPGTISYGERTASAPEVGILSLAPCLTITQVAFVRLNGGRDEREILSPARALHSLYPPMLDSVNASVVLAGGEGVYPDYCDTATQRRLAKDLASTLPEVLASRHVGEPAAIAAAILAGVR